MKTGSRLSIGLTEEKRDCSSDKIDFIFRNFVFQVAIASWGFFRPEGINSSVHLISAIQLTFTDGHSFPTNMPSGFQ